MTADDSSAASAITFDDIVGFLKGEIHMRILQISSKELRDLNKEASTLEGYEKVRKAMSKADRPAHKRPSPMGTALGALDCHFFLPFHTKFAFFFMFPCLG